MAKQMGRARGVLKLLAAILLLIPAPGAAAETACRIAVLGDSLASAYGLEVADGFPAELQRRLDAEGYECAVLDAGVSGDTTAGGLARLDWVLRQRVDLLLVELGANDGLRGLSTSAMRDNLARIIETAQARGIRVVLGCEHVRIDKTDNGLVSHLTDGIELQVEHVARRRVRRVLVRRVVPAWVAAHRPEHPE